MKSKAQLTSSQMTPGIMISLEDTIYRVDSAIKVTAPKGAPFIKTKLCDVVTDKVIEKNFKEGQVIEEVALDQHSLEFLYVEGKDYLFLDIDTLEKVNISQAIIKDKVNYLKEGIAIKAMLYGSQIFSVELPQFLELMVVKTEGDGGQSQMSGATKTAYLETGAQIEVPLFVESGDILKVDTSANTYIQRI